MTLRCKGNDQEMKVMEVRCQGNDQEIKVMEAVFLNALCTSHALTVTHVKIISL